VKAALRATPRNLVHGFSSVCGTILSKRNSTLLLLLKCYATFMTMGIQLQLHMDLSVNDENR